MMSSRIQLILMLRSIVLLGALLCSGTAALAGGAESSAVSGPFPVVRVQSVTLQRGDLADVYAPAVPSVLADRFADRFPIVAVLQGGFVDKVHYEHLGQGLARLGFVTVIPNRLRTLPGLPVAAPLPDVNLITDVLAAMSALDVDSESTLFQIIDTARMGVVGHSLGGAVALYGVAGLCVDQICDGSFERPAALQAAAVYGTNLVGSDSSILDLETSAAPVALFQGTVDGVSTPAEAAATYPTLEAPRALITIDGANHFGICDENNPPGALPDTSTPTLSQEEAVSHVTRWIGVWLHAQLSNSRAARTLIYDVGRSLDGVVRVELAD